MYLGRYYLVSLYCAEEVEVGLVRYASVNNQNFAVDHRSDWQKAEHILKQLKNLTAKHLQRDVTIKPLKSMLSQPQ